MNEDINERNFGYWVLLAISVKKKVTSKTWQERQKIRLKKNQKAEDKHLLRHKVTLFEYIQNTSTYSVQKNALMKFS
jgi:hypothetical protein